MGELITLMALPPVLILPVSYFLFKEKLGWQALIGTGLAITGVAVLFLAESGKRGLRDQTLFQ